MDCRNRPREQMLHFFNRGVRLGRLRVLVGLVAIGASVALGQSPQPDSTPSKAAPPAAAQAASQSRPPRVVVASEQSNLLRGAYGTYRANNDLVYYHLDVRVDPERKTISGKNTIRFKMLADGE